MSIPGSRTDTPGRRDLTPRPAGSVTPRRGQASPAVARGRGLGLEADGQYQLFTAIDAGDIDRVRIELARMGPCTRKSIVLSASNQPAFRFRTPLMAAAESGDFSIFMDVLEACKLVLSWGGPSGLDMGNGTPMTMREQLEMVDMHGMTLLMHATRSGDVAIFQAVANEICSSQARKLLPRKDAHGMTFLMYAASAGRRACAFLSTSPACSPARPRASTPVRTPGRHASQISPNSTRSGENVEDATEHDDVCDSSGLPLVKTAMAFAKQRLWMPEYRALLKARDLWGRSIIEHAVASDDVCVFEAVYSAVRNDVLDKELDKMLETGEDTKNELSHSTAMSAALTHVGQDMKNSVAKKIKALKKDVSLRTEASTVVSKIQSFIPGNLIVIFQLLLPEFSESSDDPLIMLIVLCFIAPFWAWGASLVINRDPEQKHALARHTVARYVLSVPAMFFWGVGTSAIGPTSFGWGETTSAAALAVATIVIPALDSFFAGRGARTCWGKIVIASLDIFEWLQRKAPCCRICTTLRLRRTKRTKRTDSLCITDSPI